MMKFIVTVDTEADNQWLRGNAISTKNIEYLPRFQELCARYRFPPTYFITYEVAHDPRAIELLRKWQSKGDAEVGAHLHPWATPPRSRKDEAHRYPSELPEEELRAKFETLTDSIEKNIGKKPTSYRAGRWGFDRRQISLLREFGYRVDCSVTPKISWRHILGDPLGNGGPDFRTAPLAPYYDGGILEIPMTILFTRALAREGTLFARWFLALPSGFLKSAVGALWFRQRWLRIFPESKDRHWGEIYRAAARNNLPLLQFMIHSSELMPGGSPYAKTSRDVERIYYHLNSMFRYFASQNVHGVTASQLAEEFLNT